MQERSEGMGAELATTVEATVTPVDAADHVDGPTGAHATLVVYGDYECPFTRGTHQTIRHLLSRREVDFRYVFRHFPLAALHPHATNAARAAEAAASIGRFWQMHDTLFAHQDALDDAALLRHAVANGVGAAGVRAALEQGVHDRRIARDLESGLAAGVRGTPTLFVSGRRYVGPRRSRELGAALRDTMPSVD